MDFEFLLRIEQLRVDHRILGDFWQIDQPIVNLVEIVGLILRQFASLLLLSLLCNFCFRLLLFRRECFLFFLFVILLYYRLLPILSLVLFCLGLLLAFPFCSFRINLLNIFWSRLLLYWFLLFLLYLFLLRFTLRFCILHFIGLLTLCLF